MVAISLCPLLMKNYSSYDLIPLIETWLENEGFNVSVLANRVDGVKKTGIFSSERIRLYFKDFPSGCSVEIEGSTRVCQSARDYLLQLSPKPTKPEKEVVIKEKEVVKEVVMIPCQYCGTLMPQTASFCPNCRARRKA